MRRSANPEWFEIHNQALPEIMKRLERSVESTSLPISVRHLPLKALWFTQNSLFLACESNRMGMHANSISLTRQCLEAISIVELGISAHPNASGELMKWNSDNITPGKLRQWLAKEIWPSYGSGLWDESWANFMEQFSKAVQPYAHYSAHLSRWQDHLLEKCNPSNPYELRIRISPQAYDPQKASRITLYHAMIAFVFSRIWSAANKYEDIEFCELIDRLGKSLAASKYLDGHKTNWEEQFWAILWTEDGRTLLE